VQSTHNLRASLHGGNVLLFTYWILTRASTA
jgi:hypothetical protein